MEQVIKKWGRLEQSQQTQEYDLGGILQGAGGMGAGIGTLIGGPIGGVIGGLAGQGLSMIGGIFNNAKQKKLEKEQSNQELKMQNQMRLDSMPKSGAGLAVAPMFSMGGYLTPEILARNGCMIKKGYAYGGNMEREGEYLQTRNAPIPDNPNMMKVNLEKGGFVNPLATQYNGLVNYSSGGTHAQNPIGGIPLGKSMKGKQNTVEQGETSFKFKEGKYIFSNRLKLNK